MAATHRDDQDAGRYGGDSRGGRSASLLATVVYLWQDRSAPRRSPAACGRSTRFSWHKWWFDELYDFVFVRPTLAIGAFVAVVLDRGLIDGIIDCAGCDRQRHRA